MTAIADPPDGVGVEDVRITVPVGAAFVDRRTVSSLGCVTPTDVSVLTTGVGSIAIWFPLEV